MAMIQFYLQAPFAVFRRFSAGSFRPTASFITPTAARGLALNLAGIESRQDDGKSVMTLTKSDLPAMNIAIGIPMDGHTEPSLPESESVFQQLHNYPVGNSAKDHAPNTKGTKYNITPVRREFLRQLTAIIAVSAEDEICTEISAAIDGTSATPRYGIPFLGDNSFLIDVLATDSRATQPAWWLTPVTDAESTQHHGELITRLTTFIDRADSSKSRSQLFAPLREQVSFPPNEAWIVF